MKTLMNSLREQKDKKKQMMLIKNSHEERSLQELNVPLDQCQHGKRHNNNRSSDL